MILFCFQNHITNATIYHLALFTKLNLHIQQVHGRLGLQFTCVVLLVNTTGHQHNRKWKITIANNDHQSMQNSTASPISFVTKSSSSDLEFGINLPWAIAIFINSSLLRKVKVIVAITMSTAVSQWLKALTHGDIK